MEFLNLEVSSLLHRGKAYHIYVIHSNVDTRLKILKKCREA